MTTQKERLLAEWWEEGCSPPKLFDLLAALIKDSHAPYDFSALVKRIEALENSAMINDAIEVCRMVAASSMGSSSSNGESSIGWQRDDGVTAMKIRSLARGVVATVGKKK
jgi:hypothetical protein